MKLKHDAICAELRSWAAETKQEIVAAEVAQAYFDLGGDELPLTPIEDEHATRNNKQRLFRWVDSDTDKARAKIAELTPAILQALPGERRARLENPNSVNYLAAQALRDFSLAMSAVLLGCSDMSQKLIKATEAIHALIPVTQQLIA
ncbi:TPA: tRNA-(guanine-N1)-methyltransferase [Yersinia enterocolitica]|nr:tRNA-(guanine-N1)-methyltransferase [Yersinia enterocolitica]